MPKNKRRSCGLCKPHKRGLQPRDTARLRMEKREAKADAKFEKALDRTMTKNARLYRRLAKR